MYEASVHVMAAFARHDSDAVPTALISARRALTAAATAPHFEGRIVSTQYVTKAGKYLARRSIVSSGTWSGGW